MIRPLHWIAAAALVCSASLANAAVYSGTYTGQYGWLSYYHSSFNESATYYENAGPNGAWLADNNAGNNNQDAYRSVIWDNPVVLDGATVGTWEQSVGSVGAWDLQYSADGATGWTTVGSSSGTTGGQNFSFGPVTAKGLRVLFAAGTYNVTAAANSGPGVSTLLAKGNIPGGIPLADPEFNILGLPAAPTGILANTPSISQTLNGLPFVASPTTGENNPGILRDYYVGLDGPRSGFYPPVDPTASFIIDLKEATFVTGVRMYGGTFYTYLPTTANVEFSYDGINYNSVGLATLSNNVVSLSGINKGTQFIRLSNFTGGSYVLPNELFVSIPEPTSAALIGLAGLPLLAKRRRARGV